MFTKIPATYWKVFGVVFTSVLAPLGLRLVDTGHQPPPCDARPAAAVAPAPADDRPPPAVLVRAAGTGPSPEAAVQDAVDAALRRVVAAEVGTADWRLRGPAYLAALRADGAGILRGWRQVSGSSDRFGSSRVFQAEVSVEVDVAALRDRLRAIGPAGGR